MVKDWNMVVLIRLYKNKGDKRICDNYRSIWLLVVAGKYFARILLTRIQGMLDRKLREEQAGFRSDRSTNNQAFTLKIVLERSMEFNQPLYMCFVALQKSYDSVNREALWRVYHAYGLSNFI